MDRSLSSVEGLSELRDNLRHLEAHLHSASSDDDDLHIRRSQRKNLDRTGKHAGRTAIAVRPCDVPAPGWGAPDTAPSTADASFATANGESAGGVAAGPTAAENWAASRALREENRSLAGSLRRLELELAGQLDELAVDAAAGRTLQFVVRFHCGRGQDGAFSCGP